MLAVGPAMDGDFPQHEAPPAGSVLYSAPPLQSPLCGSSVQVSPALRVRPGAGWCPHGGILSTTKVLSYEPLGFFAKAMSGTQGVT